MGERQNRLLYGKDAKHIHEKDNTHNRNNLRMEKRMFHKNRYNKPHNTAIERKAEKCPADIPQPLKGKVEGFIRIVVSVLPFNDYQVSENEKDVNGKRDQQGRPVEQFIRPEGKHTEGAGLPANSADISRRGEG